MFLSIIGVDPAVRPGLGDHHAAARSTPRDDGDVPCIDAASSATSSATPAPSSSSSSSSRSSSPSPTSAGCDAPGHRRRHGDGCRWLAAAPSVTRARALPGRARRARRRSSCPLTLRGSRRLPRTTQLVASPVGLPSPWVGDELRRRSSGRRTSGGRSRNSALIAAADRWHRRAGVVAGGLRHRPVRSSAAARWCTRCSGLGLLFPIAVAILPLFVMLRQLGLLDNPLGVALPQAAFALPVDDHHPAALLPGDPDARSRRRRIDRRVRAIPVLLVGDAAAVAAGAEHDRGDRRRRAAGTRSSCRCSCSRRIADQHTLPIGVNNISTQYSTDYRSGAGVHDPRHDPGPAVLCESPSARSSAASPAAQSRSSEQRAESEWRRHLPQPDRGR